MSHRSTQTRHRLCPGFGSCPSRGCPDGLRSAGQEIWGCCDVHRTKWRTGRGVPADAANEAKEMEERDAVLLEQYEDITGRED